MKPKYIFLLFIIALFLSTCFNFYLMNDGIKKCRVIREVTNQYSELVNITNKATSIIEYDRNITLQKIPQPNFPNCRLT